jgi:hypothetical protein
VTSDPFHDLRAELVSAEARLNAAGARAPRRPWRRRPRPLVIVLVALVVCGSAAAAVVSLNSTSSQPLAGTVPGTPASNVRAGTVAGYRYRITVTPSLSVGGPGWTSSINYTNPTTGLSGGGASGGGGYPTRADPVLQGASLELITPNGRHHAETVAWVLTGPEVAAVRVGKRVIRTFSSRLLPAGDRAAVYFLRPGATRPAIVFRTGGRSELSFLAPGTGSQPIPLDARGEPIPTPRFPPTPSYAAGSFWQAKSAITPSIHEPAYRGLTQPRPGICELTQHGLRGLTPEWGRTITSIPPVTNAAGELFISCIDTEYYLNGTPLNVGVLLDARHPGKTLDTLPGTQPVPGHDNLVDDSTAHLTAARVGNAWLVVKGGFSRSQRLRALQAITISKLDLHDIQTAR